MLLTVLLAIESNVKTLRPEDLANVCSTPPLVDVLCRREITQVLRSDDKGYLSFGCDCTARQTGAADCQQFGSARDGLREWRLQRLTAIAVIPLSLYFAASILSLAISGRKTAADWLSLPVLALVVILVVLAGGHACADRRWLGRSRLCSHAHSLLVAELLSSIVHLCKARAVRHGRPVKAWSQRFHYTLASGNGGACCRFGGLRLT